MKKSRSRRWAISLTVAFWVLTGIGSLWMRADDSANSEWKVPTFAARKKNPIAADDKSVAAGKALFGTQCASCHGPSGKGDGPVSGALNPKPKNLSSPEVTGLTDGALFYMITTGKTPMPAFEKLIPSDDDRWNVVNFVRTLQPSATSQPATAPSTTPSTTAP